jgi:hypothetical protein
MFLDLNLNSRHPGDGALVPVSPNGALALPAKPQPEAGLRFRYEEKWALTLRQLFVARRSDEGFSMGVCPVKDEESGVRLAALLGFCASQLAQGKVLIIEANFERPCLARLLDVPPSPGLREMLRPVPDNRFDCIYSTAYPNLYAIPAGGLGGESRPEELQARFRWMHEMVYPHFRSVIISYPAAGDAGLEEIYSIPDTMALAVKPDSCRARAVRKAVESLKRAGAKLAGSILSD